MEFGLLSKILPPLPPIVICAFLVCQYKCKA